MAVSRPVPRNWVCDWFSGDIMLLFIVVHLILKMMIPIIME